MKPGTSNIFLPFRKKSKRKGWIGFLWNLLNRIGPVTRSSPFRRVVQVLCLVIFLDAFFRVCWPFAERFDNDTISTKEWAPVESFLLIDPLVGLSTALASFALNYATLIWMIAIIAFCILIPRAFCGYFCPLGTLIDTFDWLVGRWFKRWHVPDNPTGLTKPRWWVHIKYYLLTAILISSLFGILISGYFSAIPVLTRGLLFSLGRFQLWLFKGENQLTPLDVTFFVSLSLFVGVFLLSLMGRRFWCRYVCPSGALLSFFNIFRVGERKVEDSCINCNKCVEICPFDAIEEDFTTRENDCTFCQSCGGVCPTQSIKFVTRWNDDSLKEENHPEVEPRAVSRRGFVAAAALGAATAMGTKTLFQIGGEKPLPLRPPGSVPEKEFLDLCIRCGECFKVCPGPVLHPAGLDYGLEAMWTPVATPEHAGCHQDCNFCTQVCPTGAIQPLDILVKQKTHMGLAVVNKKTCLPFDGENREDCNLCYVECEQAGYRAIEMKPIEIPIDREELEAQGFSEFVIDEMSKINAPVVDPEKCTGCGICTYRCQTTYVKQTKRMDRAAIIIEPRNEHRLLSFPKDPEDLGPPTT